MEFSSGLALKLVGGVLGVGTVSTGTWAIVSKTSWTSLDYEAFTPATGSTWTWSWTSTPANDSTDLTTNPKIEAKITLTGTSTSTPNTQKTWICTITGKIPETIKSGTIKVKTQMDSLKSVFGTETSGTWSPEDSKKPKLEKFFTSCVRNRTFEEWKNAKWGNKAESNIVLNLVATGSNNSEIKFEEKQLQGLYETATTQ